MSSARETFKRRSKRQDQTDRPVTQTDFSGALVKNAPHDEIGASALAGLINAHAFPRECQPRLGTRLKNFTVPSIRTAITATKDGTVITADGFTEEDVSNYFVWPDEDIHDEIIQYMSPTQIRVHRTGNKGATAGCWMHGRLNLCEWHQSQQRMVWQWGTRVYINGVSISDGYLILGSLTEALCVSRETPFNVISDWSEMDDYGVIYNSNGIFLVEFDTPTIFKKNTPIPTNLPDDVDRFTDSKYRYDILYSMRKLSGQGIRNCGTSGTVILQESGTTDIDQTKNPARDNAIIWTEDRIDSGIRTNGQLTGGELAAAQQAPTYWAGLNNASFRWTVNGREEEFVCDFSLATGANVSSLTEVAAEIQRVIRLVFYAATCEYDADEQRFVLTSGEEDGSTVGFGVDGTGGTNIAVLACFTAASGAVIDNANIYAQPYSFGPFYIPTARTGIDTYVREWHWTHYVLYRTPDIGPDGVTPRIGFNGEILPPLKFGYTEEVRVAGAMFGSKDIDGLVTITRGTFEIYDVGTSLEWEDGTIDTIIQWVSATQVYVTSEYFEAKPPQAMAIGGGRVFRASQDGYTVTREGGSEFTEADEGRMIWWSTDYVSIITEFIDAETVLVSDSNFRETQGMTIDPISRMINSITNDETIRNRFDELFVGALRHRFWYQMPNANIGEVVPGFMVTAIRNTSFLHYCQLGTRTKYLSGYHLPNRQTGDKIEESIQTLKIMPDQLIVWCKGETWAAPTNDPRIQTLPEFGEAYSVLFFDIVDGEQGITDTGSIVKIKSGLLEMVLTDNSVRQFDGFKYGPDLSINKIGQDIIKQDLKDTWGIGTSLFDNKLGHIIWRISR